MMVRAKKQRAWLFLVVILLFTLTITTPVLAKNIGAEKNLKQDKAATKLNLSYEGLKGGGYGWMNKGSKDNLRVYSNKVEYEVLDDSVIVTIGNTLGSKEVTDIAVYADPKLGVTWDEASVRQSKFKYTYDLYGNITSNTTTWYWQPISETQWKHDKQKDIPNSAIVKKAVQVTAQPNTTTQVRFRINKHYKLNTNGEFYIQAKSKNGAGWLDPLYKLDNYYWYWSEPFSDTTEVNTTISHQWNVTGGYAGINHTNAATEENASDDTGINGTYRLFHFNFPNQTNTTGYWQFDEDSATEALDISGNRRNGTVGSATWTSTARQGGGAYVFNGTAGSINVTDYMELGNNQGELTVMAWIYPLQQSDQDGYFITKWDAGNYSWGFVVREEMDLQALFTNNTALPANSRRTARTTTTLSTNTWYHVAFIFDNGAIELYINGTNQSYSLVHTQPITNISDSELPLMIGARGNGGAISRHFNGTIDEVKLINKALEPSDILAEYEASSRAVQDDTLNHGNAVLGSSVQGDAAEPTWTTSGKFGGALEYDGTDDYVSLGNISPAVDEDINWSTSLWVKFEENDTLEGISGYFADNQPYYLLRRFADNKIDLSINDNNGCTNIGTLHGFTEVYADGEWHSIIVTYNDIENATLYLDGVEENSTATDRTCNSLNERAFRLGDVEITGTAHLNGSIDEFRVYNHTLSFAEVLNISTGGYFTSANITSTNISILNEPVMLNFTAAHTLAAGTGVHYAILNNSNKAQLCNISSANAAAGYNVTSCIGSNTVINVMANMTTTDTTATPKILSYNLTMYNNSLTLDFDPSNLINNTSTSVTVSCTDLSALTTIVLRRNSTIVANPYVTTLGVGKYFFNCTATRSGYETLEETETLTVTKAIGGCSNSTTYAFRGDFTATANISIINMSTYITSGEVREDLKDVYVNASYKVFRNATQEMVVINNTGEIGTVISLWFGNIFNNNSVAEWNSTNTSTDTLTNVTQENNYMLLTLFEEIDQDEETPPDTNFTITAYCSGGSNTAYFLDTNTATRFLAATSSNWTSVVHTYTYNDSSFYKRSRLLDGGTEIIDYWVVDANTHTVAQLVNTLADYTGSFGRSYLYVKKFIGSNLEIIDSQQFDASNLVYFYGVVGERYQYHITSLGGETRSFGDIIVATEDLTKTISISSVTYTDLKTIGDVTHYAEYNNTTGVFNFYWDDTYEETNQINITIINIDNSTTEYTSSSNSDTVTFTTTVGNTTAKYSYRVEYDHESLGEGYFSGYFHGGILSDWYFMTNGYVYWKILAIVMMLLVILSTSFVSYPLAMVVSTIFLIMFIVKGMLDLSLGIVAVLIGITVLVLFRRAGEEK